MDTYVVIIVVQQPARRWGIKLLQNIGTCVAVYGTSYSKCLIIYQYHCENLRFFVIKVVSLTMFLSMASCHGSLVTYEARICREFRLHFSSAVYLTLVLRRFSKFWRPASKLALQLSISWHMMQLLSWNI